MARYNLFLWPHSQAFIGVPGCVLVLPPPGGNHPLYGSLESAYLVPEDVGIDDVQCFVPPLPEDGPFVVDNSGDGELRDYDGRSYRLLDEDSLQVPVS